MIAAILATQYDPVFAFVTFGAVAVYVGFTLAITEWRMEFRHEMNRLDSQANNQAFDSLINYETVKYFGNEQVEAEVLQGDGRKVYQSQWCDHRQSHL